MTRAAPHALATSGALPVDQVAALTRAVTRLSVAVAVILTAAKAVIYLYSGSVALLASLADSALDVVAALATYTAVRYAAAPPDREHRYGHGKAEAFASLLQAGLVFASAALVGEEAIGHLFTPKPIAAEGWAMAVMAASTVLTLALVWAQTRMLRQAVTTRPAAASHLGDRSQTARPMPKKAKTFEPTSTM